MERISWDRLAAVIVIAVCLILFFVKWYRAREKKNEEDRGLRDTYIIEGMSIGMAVGALITFTVYKDSGILLILGMMAGMAIGMFLPKKK